MYKAEKRIVLGSSSVHRQGILRAAGVPFEAMNADVDEKAIRRDDPCELTLVLADAKRDAIVARLGPTDDLVLVTGDLVVFCDGHIREKPKDAAEARLWLSGYGAPGQELSVVSTTTVSVIDEGALRVSEFVTDIVRIGMEPLGDAVTEALLLRPNTLSVAGALVLEDPLMAMHVRSYANSTNDPIDAKTSAIGLPIVQTLRLLRDYGAIADGPS
jgi:septum formation protein